MTIAIALQSLGIHSHFIAAARENRMRQQHLNPTQKTIAPSQTAIAQPLSGEIAQHSTHPIEQLQGAIGNRAVNQLLANQPIVQAKPMFRGLSHELVVQPKLTIGAVGDKYEREADLVAANVVSKIHAPQSPAIQREEMPEEDEELGLSPTIQRCSIQRREETLGGGEASLDVESAINSAKGSGQPLDAGLQQSLGQTMGADFSGVRVHTDPQSDQLNRSIQAKAFTTGQDVFFRQGLYQPGSRSGQELIAHELTHVVQQTGSGVAQSQKSDIQALPASENTVQRKFGFEVEVPIFLTYTAPGAPNANAREDAMAGSGGGAVFSPTSNFDLKVDHNRELQPLVSYEQKKAPGPDRFPSGPSIIEMVTQPWDEQTLTIKDVKAKVREMVYWIENARKNVEKGEFELGGGYYLGSDSPDAQALQTTFGYIQSTYGVKLSSVPKLVEETTAVNPDVEDHEPLNQAAAAAKQVMEAVRQADTDWDTAVSDKDSKSLEGYILLLANYLIAGGREGPLVGLGKNAIGQYFYKTDMGKLSNALPQSVIDRLEDRSNNSIDRLYLELLNATGRNADEKILKGAGPKCGDWIWDVLWGKKDTLLSALKNPYSAELGPDPLGPASDLESGVVLENREIQYLDPNYKDKKKKGKKELNKFNSNKRLVNDQLAFQKMLAKMTDPKKFPTNKWEDMMLTVYAMVKDLNS
jgi:Domain of unknown function (DUF4157)